MTTIDELIEKAARKAARYVFDTWGDADGVVWSGLSDRDKEYARDCARAVLNVSGESVTSLSSLQERNRKLEEELAAERAAKKSLASSIAPGAGRA